MTFSELAVRVLAQAEPLLVHMLAVAVPTILLLPVFLHLGKRVWVDQRRFRWLGLFLGLSGWDCLRLACAWIKLLLLISFLAVFRKLGAPQYLMFLVPGVLQCLSARGALRVPGRLVWFVLEFAALLSCNMVCGYIRDVTAETLFYVLYICMALFTALFGVYLFLTELNDISAGRGTNFEYEWNTGAGNGEGE